MNTLVGYCNNHIKMLLNSIGLLAHLVYVDLARCETLTCLWENDANIQVKELFSCQWIVANEFVIVAPHELINWR